MVFICIPDFSGSCGPGYTSGPCDTDENFSFVEFWAPPPTGTIWTVAGDRCTWARAAPGT